MLNGTATADVAVQHAPETGAEHPADATAGMGPGFAAFSQAAEHVGEAKP